METKDNLSHLDNHMRMLLFQTIRELFFNVVKHAGTSQVTIRLEQVDERARVTISDTGKGFDTSAVLNDSKAAHGLLVIQDRLGLMGCGIDIVSQPGQGTQIVIEAPMGASSS